MKKIIYSILTLVCIVFSGCRDFEELEENPNRPSAVPAALVFRSVQADMTEEPWSLEHRQNQFWCCNYGYYGNNEYWTNASFTYFTLKNVVRMEEEAAKTLGEANEYTALGKFFRAFFYDRMSQKVGDIPMREALLGLENPAPAYDSQKDVYLQILTWLEEANNELANYAEAGHEIQGDIYFGGDLSKWQRVVNSFTLRILIRLSKKVDDASFNVEQKFAEIISDPDKYPLMRNNDDNLSFTYNGSTELYPTGPGNRGFDKGRYNMAMTYVKGLTALKDPRVFVTCNPALKKIRSVADGGAGLAANDFNAFVGAPSGESLDDMTFKIGNGEYSYANQKRYYTTLKGPEPAVQISFWEQNFNIAEAINRGWVAGDAEEFYVDGIMASMEFFGVTDGAKLSITDPNDDRELGSHTVSLDDYFAQTEVQYAGNNATGLAQILTQKYLAFFQNSGQEAYYNFRRTGTPAFHAGPGTGNSNIIPRRWLYPTNEALLNELNLNSALQRQFGNKVDDVDQELWINQ